MFCLSHLGMRVPLRHLGRKPARRATEFFPLLVNRLGIKPTVLWRSRKGPPSLFFVRSCVLFPCWPAVGSQQRLSTGFPWKLTSTFGSVFRAIQLWLEGRFTSVPSRTLPCFSRRDGTAAKKTLFRKAYWIYSDAGASTKGGPKPKKSSGRRQNYWRPLLEENGFRPDHPDRRNVPFGNIPFQRTGFYQPGCFKPAAFQSDLPHTLNGGVFPEAAVQANPGFSRGNRQNGFKGRAHERNSPGFRTPWWSNWMMEFKSPGPNPTMDGFEYLFCVGELARPGRF